MGDRKKCDVLDCEGEGPILAYIEMTHLGLRMIVRTHLCRKHHDFVMGGKGIVSMSTKEG
jgi:hypothetical protein